MRVAIVTYIPELINKIDMTGILLLTKNGNEVSVLTSKEKRIKDEVSLDDESRRTIILERPLIGGSDEYDEESMLEMLEEAAVLYIDFTYNGETLFTDEIWLEELAFYNDSRCIRIMRPILRNFWNPALRVFKNEQRAMNRDFDKCLKAAFDKYLRLELESRPTEDDSDDILRIAHKMEQDIWVAHDMLKERERERYILGGEHD